MIVQVAIIVLAVVSSSAIFTLRISRMKAAMNGRFDGSEDPLRSWFTWVNQKLDRTAQMLHSIRYK